MNNDYYSKRSCKTNQVTQCIAYQSGHKDEGELLPIGTGSVSPLLLVCSISGLDETFDSCAVIFLNG